MEQQRVHDRDRIWAEWMRAANAGDEIAYRRLLEALAPVLRQVVRRGFAHWDSGIAMLKMSYRRRCWPSICAGAPQRLLL